MAGGWVPDRRFGNTHPYAAVRALDITHVEMDCAKDATRGHTARPRLITECVHLHPRLKTSQMVFFFSFLAIFGSACFLPVKGPLLLTLLKDPPTAGSRGDEPHHVHDFGKRGNISLQGFELELGSPR